MILFAIALTIFLTGFILGPLAFLFWKSAGVSIHLAGSVITNILVKQAIFRSFALAAATTLSASLIAFPLAYLASFREFPGRKAWDRLLLLPLVAPPFVAAIGMRHILARFGTINLLLMKLPFITNPIDFLGSGLTGIFILQVLHLYPIIYLNLRSSFENLDFSCIEASSSLGAGPWSTFRKILLPLTLPGYFSGAYLVFLWSLTDLGTPLVFDYPTLIPIMIFQSITDIYTNPAGYILIIIVSILSLGLFAAMKRTLAHRSFIGVSRFTSSFERKTLSRGSATLATAGIAMLLIISLLPHAGVLLSSLSERWFFTPFPEKISLHYYRSIAVHASARKSLINSLGYSTATAILAGVLALSIGYILSRTRFKLRGLIDTITILPMAIPGIVFAFAFLTAFTGTILDPRTSPILLLILSYALKRLPFAVRSVHANFQQLPLSLEEASANLGATRFLTFRRITFPMLKSGLLAGIILTFAFSMMEVSSSLILVSQESRFPVAKAIYMLAGRITDGPAIASALGVIGMIITLLALYIVSRLSGKRSSISISL